MITQPIETLNNIVTLIIIGACVGLIFDILCFSYIPTNDKTKKVTTFISDIVRWLIFAISFILALYYLNNGSFRFMFLFAELTGLVAYNYIFSKTINKCLHLLVYPIRKIVAIIVRILKKTVDFFAITIAKSKKKLYNKIKG